MGRSMITRENCQYRKGEIDKGNGVTLRKIIKHFLKKKNSFKTTS